MITFTLLVIYVSAGFWEQHPHELRVEHIPTQAACEQLAAKYRKQYNITDNDTNESANCIPVVEKP